MLTAKDSEDDPVKRLEFGADYYITKLFTNRGLVARIKAMLSRFSATEEVNEAIEIEGLSIDPARGNGSLSRVSQIY